ncbi:MAG: hypothetical protein D8M59_14070 [Planctomycetes bacterium]|nr:hypothetical protein [Planctomycetota bacterium]NOG55635.1 hypothetical protein [Planctomycetota bacterium]
MKVTKYWHRETQAAQDREGSSYALIGWGGSSRSIEEARQRARDKLQRMIDTLGRGEDLHEYEYHNGELREELIEQITDNRGTLIAAVTRNRYGALVLNAANVLIADIDLPNTVSIGGLLGSIFGRKKKGPSPRDTVIDSLHRIASQHPAWRLHVYDTHSGLRVFETSRPYDPTSNDSQDMLAALNSDTLYRSLCRTQQCYRARLTPKPWRCNSQRPPNTFPRESKADQREFDQWLSAYNDTARRYTVCRLNTTIGNGIMTDEAMQVMAVHDSYALNDNADQIA